MNTVSKRKISPLMLLLVLASLLSILSLGGCQSNAESQTSVAIDQEILDRRIGHIESLEGLTNASNATHLLKMENGSTILLNSIALNLNDAKYSAKTLEVSGVLNYTKDNKPLMVVQNIEILEDNSPTQQAPAPTWQEYKNEDQNFGIRYRDDFIMDEDKDSNTVTFRKEIVDKKKNASTQDSKSIVHVIEFSLLPKVTDSKQLLKSIGLSSDSASALSSGGFTKSKVGSESFNAYKKSSEDGSIDFYVEVKEKFFHISYEGGTDADSLDDQNVFYDVLNSFHVLHSATPTQQTTSDPDIKMGSKTLTKIVENKAPLTITQEKKPEVKPATSSTSGTSFDSSSFDEEKKKPSVSPAAEVKSETVVAPLAQDGATQELTPGYEAFVSTGYKFSLQYPKRWYYSSGTSLDTKVIKHYDFGTKPLEEVPGTVGLDILSGAIPGGTSFTHNDQALTKISNGDTVEIYVKGSKSRVYRLTGPAADETSLAEMAASIED